MPYKIIKGSFHVVNYSPDGDSVRFQPDDVDLLHSLDGFRPRLNRRNHIQLRMEAIDTLETHYSLQTGGGVVHQPLDLAYEALDFLMEYLGIEDVEWDRSHKTVMNAKDGKRGYVITKEIEKNGRLVAFVYTGESNLEDGSDFFLDAEKVKDSYNYQSVLKGLSYVTFYTGLFHDLRAVFIQAVKEAREQNRGIYTTDATTDGFHINNLKVIVEEKPILPKLFRRLAEYVSSNGNAKGFKQKLAQAKEKVMDLRTSNFTHFDTFIEQEAGSVFIRMTRFPEELVFDPMPSRPVNNFSSILESEDAKPPKFVETVTLPEEAVRDLSV